MGEIQSRVFVSVIVFIFVLILCDEISADEAACVSETNRSLHLVAGNGGYFMTLTSPDDVHGGTYGEVVKDYLAGAPVGQSGSLFESSGYRTIKLANGCDI
ncbi:MAG: hypothetical protein HY606_13075 [Planctomycetes bacterium]|nr:hypothetical protein [Planctomycetota bacterium]